MQFGSLSLLETSGTVQACTGIVTAYLMNNLCNGVERLKFGFDVSLSGTCTLSKA